eukprot:scaffold366651_cov17-Prasinocladus_malaysianus.AAC.1
MSSIEKGNETRSIPQQDVDKSSSSRRSENSNSNDNTDRHIYNDVGRHRLQTTPIATINRQVALRQTTAVPMTTTTAITSAGASTKSTG